MTYQWRKNGSSRLILVFNGFAMDAEPLGFLDRGRSDVLVVSAWDSLEIPREIQDQVRGYGEVHGVAWSLGVWTFLQMGEFLRNLPGRRLAVAGTPWPLHRERGIPPQIFGATCRNFSPSNREQFYRNFFSQDKGYQEFLKVQPRRTWESQKEELEFFQGRIDPGSEVNWEGVFDRVLLCREDRIVPFRAQEAAWSGHPDRQTLPAGHFPFPLFSSWEDLLGLA